MKSRKRSFVLLTLVPILVIALVCINLPGCLNYYDPAKACNGYTLICQFNVAKLIDMNGNTVKTWEVVGFPAKMLSNGSVMALKDPGTIGGERSKVVQLSWDGETEWEFGEFDEVDGVMMARAHHDFQKDGNPVGYYAPGQEALLTGGKVLVLGGLDVMDPEISSVPLLDDVVYEVDWETKEVTVLWRACEHFDELGFNDAAKQIIYQVGGDYLHINNVNRLGPNRWYDRETSTGDVRFHPDNLIMDSRESNITWIVNMVEGTGYEVGEIVWKIGPDYSAGTPEGGKLGQIIGQHHAHMIPQGLPGEGNILVFDNGGIAGYPDLFRFTSRILEFDPNTLNLVWKYEAPNFFSGFISSAQRLPNGNTLIDQGSNAKIFEVTPAGETVWEYVEGLGIPALTTAYRAYRVPPEWVPGNPAGYPLWSELYEEPAPGEAVPLNEPGPATPLQESGEPLPLPG